MNKGRRVPILLAAGALLLVLAVRERIASGLIHIFPDLRLRRTSWMVQWNERTRFPDHPYVSPLFPIWHFTDEGWVESDGVCGVSPAEYRAFFGTLSLHEPTTDRWHRYRLRFADEARMFVTLEDDCEIELERISEK